MSAYATRIVSLAVLPEGAHLTSEQATFIRIEDEGAGPFVRVTQYPDDAPAPRVIALNPDEWPAVRQAIDLLVSECGKLPEPGS